MDTKYLKTFKAILEAGSFQKAAERLNYAQSTVTLQIHLIEQELSVKLFEKIGRKMELTQAGRELLPYIDTILDTVRQMESCCRSEGELTGTLRVAMPETLLTYKMQPVLKKFHEQAPDVRLSLQTANCYVIREQVIKGSIDIGIHYDVGGYGPSLIAERLQCYPLVLIGSPQIDEEDSDFVRKGQRKKVCLLTVDGSSIYHRIFQDYLQKSDIILSGQMEICSIEAVKRSVASNLGIACLPEFTVTEELRQREIKALPADLPVNEISAVCTYHKNKWMSPAMSLFIRLMQEQK